MVLAIGIMLCDYVTLGKIVNSSGHTIGNWAPK